MTKRDFPAPLSGIVPPLVTPLTADNTLDIDATGRLLEHVIAGGVHGLFILGTTGEGPSLSYDVRRQMIELVCEQVGGRLPVLVGVTDTSLPESIDLASFALDEGADAVVCAPPCYFPMGQADLARYMTRLAQEVALPLMLYNMPALTKTVFEPATVQQLTEVRNIVGVKDSSGDMDYFAKVKTAIASRPDWALLCGPEHLLATSVALGGTGGVSGGANVAPRLFVEIYQAAAQGNHAELQRLEAIATQLGELYKIAAGSGVAVIQGAKAALSQLGICSAHMASPYQSLAQDERQQVQAILASLASEEIFANCDLQRS